jgi:hypothetical protein
LHNYAVETSALRGDADLRERLQGTRMAHRRMLRAMDTKDTFMRFVVIGSIVAVGVFALFITMHS